MNSSIPTSEAWREIAERYAANARQKSQVDTLIAAIVADRAAGVPFSEIAARLGVTVHAAKKYHLDATSGYWRPGKHDVGQISWQDVGCSTSIMDLPVSAELREILAEEFVRVEDLLRLPIDALRAALKRLPKIGPRRQGEVITLVAFIEMRSSA